MTAPFEKYRVSRGPYVSSEADGFNGMFELKVNREWVRVIISDGAGWQHVSVSKVGNVKVPNWDMMCQIKDLFFGKDVWVMQFHPPESEYVNNHPGCLHLWRPTHDRMPTPPSILTGFKMMNQKEVRAKLAAP